jgi:hypothetical protein
MKSASRALVSSLAIKRTVLCFIGLILLSDLKYHRGGRVPCRTSGKEPVAATQHRDLFDQFGNQPAGRGTLGMPVDQGAAVVVHPHGVHVHLLCHVEVIDGKRIVGLYGLDVRDLKTGPFNAISAAGTGAAGIKASLTLEKP